LTDRTRLNSLISFLTEFCKYHLLEENIFIVPSYQLGHQIGEALTINGHSCVNLHFTTIPSLAQEIAAAELSSLSIRQISWATSLFIVDKIFRSLKEERKLDYFGELEASSGIIRAISRSILALRLAALKSKDLSPESFISKNKGKEVILFLMKYEEELNEGKLVDLARLYSFALEKAEKMKRNDKKYFLCLRNQALARMELNFLAKIYKRKLWIKKNASHFYQ